MTFFLAALSITEKLVLKSSSSASPDSMADFVFLSCVRSFDMPARFLVFAFSAWRRCFSAERIFAMKMLLYAVLPRWGMDSKRAILLRFDPERLEFLPRQGRFLTVGMLVNNVLELHDSLRLLADADVAVALLQEGGGDFVGSGVPADHLIELLDRLPVLLLGVERFPDPVRGV